MFSLSTHLRIIWELFNILYVLHISQSLHIKIRPSKINFNVFINSSSSSIKCISIFSGNNVNKVFNAKSFDEKDISDKYFALYIFLDTDTIFFFSSNKIDSPLI